ncbi:hypothetical protein GIB67_011643, partial [Kingdonia uniflora]
DHLVNNAGIASLCTLEEAPEITTYRPIMDINFWGTVYPTYYAIPPHLRKSKGKIVGISSTAGWSPIPRMSFYCASKATLINFYECLRVELSPDVQVGMGFIYEKSAEDCAKDIVKGRRWNEVVICFKHLRLGNLNKETLVKKIWTSMVLRLHESIRVSVLKAKQIEKYSSPRTSYIKRFGDGSCVCLCSNRIDIHCICGRMCEWDVNVEGCAKAILNGVCRGDRYITQPAWYKALF